MSAADAVFEQQVIQVTAGDRVPSEAMLSATAKLNEKLSALKQDNPRCRVSSISHTVSLTNRNTTFVSIVAVIDEVAEEA